MDGLRSEAPGGSGHALLAPRIITWTSPGSSSVDRDTRMRPDLDKSISGDTANVPIFIIIIMWLKEDYIKF